MPKNKTTYIHKTCIALRLHNWEKRKNVKNRSAVINYALDGYFDRIERLSDLHNDLLKENSHNFLQHAKKLNNEVYMDGWDLTREELLLLAKNRAKNI